jgi:AcrR family transcriptional regulator
MGWSAAELAGRFEAFLGDIDPSTKKGQRRRAILAAATQMFAEIGYRETSMDELATAVGIGKGTLYLYFPKKVDLLIACVAREKLEWVPRMLAILESDAPATERLKQWIIAVLLLPSRSPLMRRLLSDAEMTALLADYPPALVAEAEHGHLELLQPLLDELAGSGHRWNAVELRDRANVIQSVTYIAPMLHHDALRPGMSEERFAAIFADMIVDGIRPRAQLEEGQA